MLFVAVSVSLLPWLGLRLVVAAMVAMITSARTAVAIGLAHFMELPPLVRFGGLSAASVSSGV